LENIVIFLKILKISKKKLDFFNIFDIYIEHLHIYGSELDCIYCCAVTVTVRELIVGPF